MKIYLNRKPVTGPWGGGNKTLSKLCQRIKDDNHELVFDLEDNIDVIFCYDPRPDNFGIWYQHFINYKINNPKCKIIQRVGDVGSHSKPELNDLLSQIAKLNFTDYFIFPSLWAREQIGHEDSNYSIIHNAPLKIFYNNRKQNKDKLFGKKIRLVTHHWSDNHKKGFEIYEKLGNYLAQNNNKIGDITFEFTYIGRYSKDFKTEGIEIIEPVDAKKLSEILPTHDVYLTASEAEAGANHVLEAMAVGLPVIYSSKGGSIVEYCSRYGKCFNNFNELICILNDINSLASYKLELKNYNDVIDNTIDEYTRIIKRCRKP